MAPLKEKQLCSIQQQAPLVPAAHPKRETEDGHRASRLTSAILLFLFSPFFAALAQPPSHQPDLARVAILKYKDLTRTKNFGYLPTSLTEAIDSSLQKKFVYVREDPAITDAAYRASQQKAAAKGELAGEDENLTPQWAATFIEANHTDILILGNFTFDAAAQEILVTTFISIGAKDRFRELSLRRNKVNATIFGLADKVADDIVVELTKIAKEQQAVRKAGLDDLSDDAKNTHVTKEKKLELLKIQESTLGWQAYANGGYFLPLAKSTEFLENNFYGHLAASYTVNNWLTPYLSAGVLASKQISKDEKARELYFFYTANAGLALPIEMRQFVLMPYVAGGMIFSELKSVVAEATLFVPVVEAGFYFTWYFSQSIGVSFSGSGLYTLDKPNQLLFAGGGLGLAVKF